MGRGHPTSRTPSYITGLEVLLEAKNDKIAELEATVSESAELYYNQERKIESLQTKLDAVRNEVPQWVEFTNDPATHPTDEEVMGCFGDSYSVPHVWKPKESMWKALEYINHYKYRYFWRRIGECDRPYTSLQAALNGEDDG